MLPVFRERILAAAERQRNLDLIRRRIELRTKSDPFDLPDSRFIEMFRLNKILVRQLINILRPHLINRLTTKGVTLEIKVFTALRFYAVGSYQRCVGQDFNCGLSQTTVHRCIKSVTVALANLAQEYIKLPNTRQERNSIKFEFMNRWGFPGTIGCIDGSHVAILKPNVEEHNYINRKGYHSLNVQIICDHQLKIRSLFANFGGSSHDSFIWRVSQAQQFMAELYTNNQACWLIGDAGYPLSPYLLTPFRNPENNPEIRYNTAHGSARNVIERCIGVLKMRFRCLTKERSSRYKPHFMCFVIKACSILHNMCIEENLPFEEIFNDENENVPLQPFAQQNANVGEGIRIRQHVINQYFNQ